MNITTYSSEETITLGERIGKTLKGGEVVCLYGDLGAGKTTFAKGLAQGLGIKKRILSPTFIIVRHYRINHKSAKTLYHIDFYRAQNSGENMEIGLKDWLADKSAIIVIEWPERLGKYLPRVRTDIHFRYNEENVRDITIKQIYNNNE